MSAVLLQTLNLAHLFLFHSFSVSCSTVDTLLTLVATTSQEFLITGDFKIMILVTLESSNFYPPLTQPISLSIFPFLLIVIITLLTLLLLPILLLFLLYSGLLTCISIRPLSSFHQPTQSCSSFLLITLHDLLYFF